MLYSNWDKMVDIANIVVVIVLMVTLIFTYRQYREYVREKRKGQVISLLNQFLIPFMRALKDESEKLGKEGELGSGVVVMDEPYYKLQEEFDGKVEKNETVKLLFERFISNWSFHRDRERIVELIGEHDKRIEDVEKSLNEFTKRLHSTEKDTKKLIGAFLAVKSKNYPKHVKQKLEKDVELKEGYEKAKEDVFSLKDTAERLHELIKNQHDALIKEYKISKDELKPKYIPQSRAYVKDETNIPVVVIDKMYPYRLISLK